MRFTIAKAHSLNEFLPGSVACQEENTFFTSNETGVNWDDFKARCAVSHFCAELLSLASDKTSVNLRCIARNNSLNAQRAKLLLTSLQ